MTQDSTAGRPAAPPPIDCETAVRRLWDYLDGELGDEQMEEVRAHLDACRLCPPHFDFARTFLNAVAAGRREHERPGALRDRLVAALRAEGFTGAGSV